ncbi:MAG: CBS domain-containing protein [Betaproteobacteria bacterium]|nr:CBS domain-containing protein [Betaproteobacteria bacterium]
MLESAVGELIEPRKLIVASPGTSVKEAARLMRSRKVGAVLVVRDEQLVGIFTERDALTRVMAEGRDPAATRLAEVMTPDPKTVAVDETFGYALLLMHEHGFRHLPVLEGRRPVGVISARHALDPELEEFTAEAERRKQIRRRVAPSRASSTRPRH